jgi:HK97 family phage portal protein
VRLLDRLTTAPEPEHQRFSGRGIEPSNASILTTTYGAPGAEPILPMLMANATMAYEANAVVFGAILARLMLFSEAEFKFRRLRDKSLFGTNDPDALRVLEYPWPNGTTGELLARMIQDVDLAGNAYVWNAGDQLVRLRPDWVVIVSELVEAPVGGYYRKVIGYAYDPPPTELQRTPPMWLTVDEVAHWSPIPDPMASFRGMSWMTPVLREVDADNAMTAYKTKYLQHAATPNLLVRYSQKLNQESVERVQAMITDRHGGVDNAFRTLVLDEGPDVTVVGNTFEQMNFSTVQAAGENRIIIASGVPGIVIGSKEGLMAATYSNYEQAMRRFADLTMRPLWRSVCACLSKLIVVPPNARLWYDTSDIAALRQGEKERAETMQIKVEAVGGLIRAGYDPDTIGPAVEAGDVTLLKHTGLLPVTLQPEEPDPAPAPSPLLTPAPNGATTQPSNVLNGATSP